MQLFSLAEVMDKEPAILVVWVSAFLLACLESLRRPFDGGQV